MMPSGEDGLRLELGTKDNLIGGTNPAERNIVSGNDQDGIGLQGDGVENNIIINNYVGLKQSGNTILRNGADGVDVAEGVANNWIGGLNPGYRNVISGNNRDGVEISHDLITTGNRVVGNFVGFNAAGTAGIRNGGRGVTFEDNVTANLVYRNVIVNNGGDGVRFYTVFSNQGVEFINHLQFCTCRNHFRGIFNNYFQGNRRPFRACLLGIAH